MVFRYLSPVRSRALKMLEIGIGCTMSYGGGHSIELWKRYIPNLELHMVDVDSKVRPSASLSTILASRPLAPHPHPHIVNSNYHIQQVH